MHFSCQNKWFRRIGVRLICKCASFGENKPGASACNEVFGDNLENGATSPAPIRSPHDLVSTSPGVPMFPRISAKSVVMLGLLASGCQTQPSILLRGVTTTQSRVNFSVSDMRPAEEKTEAMMSHWVTSCDWGITRLADSYTNPPRLTVLRLDLENALGENLRNKTLIVTHYTLYLNMHQPARSRVEDHYGGDAAPLVPGLLLSASAHCTKEDTSGGYFDASDTAEQTALVAEVSASLDGKPYSARSVVGLARVQGGNNPALDVLRKAGDSLATELKRTLLP